MLLSKLNPRGVDYSAAYGEYLYVFNNVMNSAVQVKGSKLCDQKNRCMGFKGASDSSETELKVHDFYHFSSFYEQGSYCVYAVLNILYIL